MLMHLFGKVSGGSLEGARREYKATNEESFLSSWLREDGREKEEIMVEVSNENEEERSERREREEEKKENATGTVKRRCDGFLSVEAFQIFSREIWSCGDLSWVDLLDNIENLSESEASVVVPEVLDVPAVPEFCDGFSCCSDWNFVELQSISFSKKRAHSCTYAGRNEV